MAEWDRFMACCQTALPVTLRLHSSRPDALRLAEKIFELVRQLLLCVLSDVDWFVVGIAR